MTASTPCRRGSALDPLVAAPLPATPRHRPPAHPRGRQAREEGLQSLSDRLLPYRHREIQTAEGKLYLFVAIDRTSKFAFVQLVEKANRVTASAFLTALVAAVPYKIHIVLTDNGIQFRLPPRYADGPTARFRHPHVRDALSRERQSSIGSPRSTIPGRTGRSRG